MTKVKIIECYDSKTFEFKINEMQKFFPAFATQTHVIYDKQSECIKFIAILYLK